MNILNAATEIAHFAGIQLRTFRHFRRKVAHVINDVIFTGRLHADLITFPDRAILDADQRYDTKIWVEPGINDQCLQRRIRITLGGRNISYQIFQNVFNVQATLGGTAHCVGRIDADNIFNFLSDSVWVRLWKVHFVQYRTNFQPLFNRGVAVSNRLSFNALRGINDQKSAFTRRQRTTHLIAEIHVSRSINKVQLIRFTVTCGVVQGDALGLDGDATFALDVHGVQNLRLHFAIGEAAAYLNKAVRQSRFAVVDVGNDGEVANVVQLAHRIIIRL